MKPGDFARFTEELRRRLEADPRVLALVALGSTAQGDTAPDEWSDHDVFVVVAPGHQEEFRSNLSWLPDASRIVLSFRETAHGVKAVYAEGHLVELAVFDLDELSLARINRYRALFDRGGIEARLAQVAEATQRTSSAAAPADDWLAGQFLTNLIVGVSRHRRGERLSGRHFVKANALSHLLVLLEKHLDSPEKGRLDGLDPFRRVEQAFPALGEELNAILDQETPLAARGLLALADRELRARLSDYPDRAVAVVERWLAGASLAAIPSPRA